MSRLLLLCLIGLAACRSSGERTVVVFAAASLREVFTALAPGFEAAHPGVRVQFNFAGTQELRTQLEHGARADVVAAADTHHLDALQAAGTTEPGVVFAHNELVVLVGEGGPLRTFADLPSASRIVLGAPEVPVGRYGRHVLDRANASLGADFRARVEARVISHELSVRQVVAKVRLGEADAALVYRTDVGPGLRALPIPAALNVRADYPVARLRQAPTPELAAAWIAWLRGPAGRSALQAAGFQVPTD